MRSIRLQDFAHEHIPRDFTVWERGYLFFFRRRFPWPSRYWQGAWATESGWIIRSWLDEVLIDEVRAAREGSQVGVRP